MVLQVLPRTDCEFLWRDLQGEWGVRSETNAKTLRKTLIGDFLDVCGVSIPCGAGDAGMPVGPSLAGLPNGEEYLLSIALAAEETIR